MLLGSSREGLNFMCYLPCLPVTALLYTLKCPKDIELHRTQTRCTVQYGVITLDVNLMRFWRLRFL